MKVTNEIKEQIIAAKRAGKTYREIESEFGVPRATANGICIRAGLRSQTLKKKTSSGKKCPVCHKGPFPTEYTFCPFCKADMRSERES